MSDVHFLGEIGGRVIDHHGLWLFHRGDAETRIGRSQRQALFQECRVQVDIDEARPGDLDAFGDTFELEFSHDARGQFARVAAHALGGGHCAVGLVIAEFGARAGGQQGLAVGGNIDRAHRLFDRGVEGVAQVHCSGFPGGFGQERDCSLRTGPCNTRAALPVRGKEPRARGCYASRSGCAGCNSFAPDQEVAPLSGHNATTTVSNSNQPVEHDTSTH